MILSADYPILRAYLHRESRMYRWGHPDPSSPLADKKASELRRQAFVRRMFVAITTAHPGEGFDYIHIQTISNIGLLMSELVLSAKDFDWKKGCVVCLLPPSPKGGVGIYINGKRHCEHRA